MFCFFHSGRPRELRAISLAYQQSQITGAPSPCHLGTGWDFRATGDLEVGPEGDTPSHLSQRSGHWDILPFYRPAYTHIQFVTLGRERSCALRGVAVYKDYLIESCPTESEFVIPWSGAGLILLFVLCITKRFAEDAKSMQKILRQKTGKCFRCMEKLHFINHFRDTSILQTTIILIDYSTPTLL